MKVLTCEQRGFVTHKSGAFVTACPGSGKTTAIVERVARLAETLPPRRGIALLSFTNTAVNEFRRGLLRYGITRGVLEHPGFVGTFDRFIIRFLFEPVSLRNQSMKLNVVPSWGDLNVKVRLAGKKATWRYQGVPLNAFRPATGELILEEVAGSPSFLAHVAAHKGEYEEEARRKRQQLLQSGLISVADVRVEILKILRFEKWARTVSEALSSRFYEMIIDEAQDCNELDYEIIRWLRRANLRISVVGDPDQAIYEFRGATPGELLRLGNEFPEKSRLSFTGNFRSSPIICALAATLRPNRNPDTALGKSKDVRIPIQLVAYTGRSPSPTIGQKFIELVELYDCLLDDAVILAHKRAVAARAAGASNISHPGSSRIALLAAAVGEYWSKTSSGKARERSLQHVERIILELMNIPAKNAIPGTVAEKHGIDARWLRRCALNVINALPRECEPNSTGRKVWIESVREVFDRLDLPHSERRSLGSFFKTPKNESWSAWLAPRGGSVIPFNFNTIHQAKGAEYDAVCLVIPPHPRTEELMAAWEEKRTAEALRVLYVGATRAKRLLCIAVPDRYRERVECLLEAPRVIYQLHKVASGSRNSDS